jgi:pimeloyl-ACP methyl ester carboxylesterase
VSVTGLGNLTNRVASASAANYEVARVRALSTIEMTNSSKTINGQGLSRINGKLLHYQKLGNENGRPLVFVHGLGGTLEYWRSIVAPYEETYSIHLFDLEGHGLSPTSPLSVLSMDSFATDLKAVFEYAGIKSGATLVAHSMGCLIAMSFAIAHPSLVENLVLMGPPTSPFEEAVSKGIYAYAEKARRYGMSAVIDDIVNGGTSSATKKMNRLGVAALRLSLLGQDPEGYAKACGALAAAKTLEVEKIQAKTLIITGDEDALSPPELCDKYASRLRATAPVILENTGHWHVFEQEAGVTKALSDFLSS